MAMAEAAAERSHDAETKVGAVLVKNDTGAVVATGYNGFVRGAPDEELPNTRPEKYPYMQHAERNIVANCARHGISMDNCKLVCTLSPCIDCMRLLWQCGVTHIVIKDVYRDMDNILNMKDITVITREDPSDGYLHLIYKSAE
jgi:dCMP deaminase